MVHNNKLGSMNVFFLITILMSSLGCNKYPEPETYLIPKGFTGRIDVILDQANGLPKKYENGRRVYEIPSNGILLTQFKDEYGIVNRQYFYVDSVGKRFSIPIYKYEHNEDGTVSPIVKDKEEIGVFIDGTTGIYGGVADKRIPYQEFIVSNLNRLKQVEPLDSFLVRMQKITGFNF
jgi:hypothetical protein